jgi:two-component system, OmpR family, heavy metal sensor histidine kinase CusS
MNSSPAAPYSLGFRLSWLFAGQTLLGLGVVSVCIYVVMFLNLSSKADTELARKSELIKHLVGEAVQSGDLPAMRHKLDDFFLTHQDLQVSLLDRSGTRVYESAGSVRQGQMQRGATFELPHGGAPAHPSWARITMDRSADAQLLGGLVVALVMATLLGAAVVSVAGFWMVRRSMAPLHILASQTRALRADQLGQRLTLDRPVQELQPWIDQFNDLLGRLEHAYRQLEGFNADVAHELRTPLATMIGQTEVELKRERSADELRETLGSNLEELHRLALIVNDMLFLSRADRGAKASPAPVASLAHQARLVLEYYEGALIERGLSACLEGDARACFDSGLVRRAISNLLSNAIRYAEPASEIKLVVTQRGALTTLVITNLGVPIPANALARLFDRFFRVQTSREGCSENHGLGLAIVAAVAHMHGGQTLATSENGVTSIGFTLSDIAAPTPLQQK